VFGIAEIIITVCFTFCIGWFFVHASKINPPKKKLWFWGLSALFFVIIWVAIKYPYNTHINTNESIKQNPLSIPNKDTLIAKSDSSKVKQKNQPQKSNNNQRIYELEHQANIRLIAIKVDTFAIGKNLLIIVYFQNFGLTSALHFKPHLEMALHTVPTFHNFSYRKLKEEQSDIELAHLQNVGIPISSDELIETKYNDIYNKRLYLYIYGKLTFWDVFHKFHITTFCIICYPKTGDYYFNSSYNEDKIYEKEQTNN
jgi:hypothetical protein